MPRETVPGWTLDPLDPRAPSDEVWDALTPEQRAIVVASLPGELDPALGVAPPEGDLHYEAADGPRRALRRWFGKLGRRAYVGTNLPVYYPDARPIAPDVFVVLDVDPRPRKSWCVRDEGKGLDVALEIHHAGSWRKDFVENVKQYAALGIREYFAFDLNTRALVGYRLDDAKGAYDRIERTPEGLRSDALGLDLEVSVDERGARVRFTHAGARIPELDELIGRLEGAMSDTLSRVAALEGALALAATALEEKSAALEEKSAALEEKSAALEAERAERAALERRLSELEARAARGRD